MRTAELVGIPIKAVVYGNSHGVIAASPSGREGMFYIPYYSTTGSALLGYHAGTQESVNVKLGSSGGYGCCVGPDGALYIGGVGPGDLYRFDPATGKVEDLGGSQFGATYIWATAVSQAGRVYCACYPTCSVLEYNIASGQLRDLGRMHETEQYVRSICVDHRGKVWAGVGQRAQLMVLDPATGEKHDVLPEEYKHNSSCYNLQTTGKYVIASVLGDGILVVFDADTEKPVRVIPRAEDQLWWMNCHGAPPGEAYFYALPDGDLYHYDIEQDKLTLLASGLGQCEQVVDGRYVHGMNDQEYFLYDLQERAYVARRKLAEAGDGMRIQTLTGHTDGNIYGSTYINQHMFGYRPASGRITDLGKVIRVGGQVDSICSGRDGKVYMGSYVHAHISVYDPRKPWRPSRDADGNPRELGEVGHGQYRTCAIALGPDDNIWLGSIPSYNSGPTGAFSRWDPETGEHESWLDLVPGGAVREIAVGDKYIYCAGGGKFFVWDPFEKEKVYEEDRQVHSLVVAPNGLLVGNAGEEMFLFDPAQMKVTKSFASPIGVMTDMTVAPNGLLYGINKEAVGEINPETWEAAKIAEEGGALLAADGDSTLYFARGAKLYRLH